MKIAMVVPAAGSPTTLGTTAFVGALAEGLAAIQVKSRVIGLTFDKAEWMPDALGGAEASAPWLPPMRNRLGDRADAAHRGIFDETSCAAGTCEIRWRRELLLERELLDFAPEEADAIVLAIALPLVLLQPVCRVAHRLGWKLVVFSNETLTNLQVDPSTRDAYIRCVTRCASGVWTVSRHLAAFWQSAAVASERVFVAPSAIRPSSFARTAAPHGLPSATYVGNLAHREIGYLLDIAGTVASQVPGFTLTIYGDAPDHVRRNLVTAISERGLYGAVRIEPPIPPVEVPGVLEESAVLVLPRSRGEFSAAGFPNKLGEYLASGRPVVTTRVGDIPEYLTDAESAFLVEPDDVAAFAAALVMVLRAPDLADAVGAQGKRVAERALRADLVAARLVAFAESLPATPACPAKREGTARLWRRAIAMHPDAAPVKYKLIRTGRALGLVRTPRPPKW